MAGSPGGLGNHPIHMHPVRHFTFEATLLNMIGFVPPAKNAFHQVRPLYRYSATLLGASMWFFLMYRAKKDGSVLLGWRHPWDH